MMGSKIEWCEETWPVVTGCSPVSEGCTNCYAARMAATRLRDHPRYKGLAEMVDGRPRWTGRIRLNEDVLGEPLRWRKQRRVFVASMGDLFHPSVPSGHLGWILSVVRACPQHHFLVLTKRAKRMRAMIDGELIPYGGVPPSNLWLGISAENQPRFDERTEQLLRTPAARHFVSLEPLLGPVDPHPYLGESCDVCRSEGDRIDNLLPGLDLVIAGAETGPGARPAELDWFRSLRDDCQEAGVPYFLKQVDAKRNRELDGRLWEEWPTEERNG